MYFQVLFHRFRWLQLPATVLVVLLQRTPVLRVLASEGPGICIRSGDLLRSAFAVAALGAYDTVAGATQFGTTVVSPTTATPTSTTATKTFAATGTVGSPFSLALNVTGAPSSLKSWKVTGTFPPGLTVSGGTAVTGGFVFNSPLKVTISGTPTSAATSTLKIAAYSGLNATGDTSFVNCAITINGAATAPAFTTDPASQSVTVGAGVTFTAVVTGSPTPTLQWFKGTTALSGKTSATLSLANVQLSDAGNYKLVATNSAAPTGVSSATATLTVNPATPVSPAFTTQPSGRTVTVGAGVTFTTVVTGSPTPTLQWFKGTTALSGKTSATLSLTNVQLSDAGDYSVVATNSAAPAGIPSEVATLVVDPAAASPTVITPLPATTTADLGDTVTLSVTASGTPSPTYSWRRGNVTLPDQTGPSLTVGPLTAADAAAYTVTISNSVGHVSSTTSLSVSLPATADLTDPGTLKTGSAVSFDLSGNRPPVTGLVYAVTGLPAGLTLDPATGLITGVITAKPGTAKLTTWTQIGKTKSTVKTATLLIGAFPTALTGAYEALLFTADDAALPVGKIGLTVSATGSFSGTLLASEIATFTLKNQLVLAPDNTSASLTFPVSRGGVLPPYTVELTVSSSPAFTARLSLGSTTAGTAPDGDLLATAAPAGAVTAYTVLLSAPVDLGTVTEFPKGTGYATAKINAKGAIAFSGKFADGVKFTGTYPLGRDNRYRVFAKPYPKDAGGYFAATLPLTARADAPSLWHVAPADGTDAYWRKPDPLAATTLYGAGFGPLALTVRLEPWIKPSAATPLASLLGLDSTGNFSVALASTSLSPTAFGLPAALHLDAKNLVSVVSATTPANPAAFTAKVNTTTGALTGGFTLAAIPPVALRKVAYTGALLQPAPTDRPGLVGGAFFLLPAATKGGDIYSGQVGLTTP